jgi:hypothetical protein
MEIKPNETYNISFPFSRYFFTKYHIINESEYEYYDHLEEILSVQTCPFRFEPTIAFKGSFRYMDTPLLIGEIDTFFDYV